MKMCPFLVLKKTATEVDGILHLESGVSDKNHRAGCGRDTRFMMRKSTTQLSARVTAGAPHTLRKRGPTLETHHQGHPDGA